MKKSGPLPSPEVERGICRLSFWEDNSPSGNEAPSLSEASRGLQAESYCLLPGFSLWSVGFFLMQRLENVLFGPHDCSHAPSDGCPVIPTNGSGEALGILARLGRCLGLGPGGSDRADFHSSRARASAETDRPLPWRRRGGGGPAGHQMPYCYCCHHIV